MGRAAGNDGDDWMWLTDGRNARGERKPPFLLSKCCRGFCDRPASALLALHLEICLDHIVIGDIVHLLHMF